MPVISERTKKSLCSTIGLEFEKVVDLDFDEEIAFVTKKNNIKPVFSKKIDKRKMGRGNPLLAKRRLKSIDDVNEGLKRIK